MNTDPHETTATARATANDDGQRGGRRRIAAWAVVTVLILLVPLVAMRFTSEVNWGLPDFAVMGVLLFGTGLAYEALARQASSIAYRAAVGVALATAFLLVWLNLAVGLIGSEANPANLMYVGVLAAGITGALIARCRADGMARALFVTALAQVLVPVLALLIWPPRVASWGAAGVFGVFVLNASFAALFVVSALLFRKAARAGPEPDAAGQQRAAGGASRRG